MVGPEGGARRDHWVLSFQAEIHSRASLTFSISPASPAAAGSATTLVVAAAGAAALTLTVRDLEGFSVFFFSHGALKPE